MSESLPKLIDWAGAALIAYATTRWTLYREDARQAEAHRKTAEAAAKERRARLAADDLARCEALGSDLLTALTNLSKVHDFAVAGAEIAFEQARDRCAEIETRLRTLVDATTWSAIGSALEAAAALADMTARARASRGDSGVYRELENYRKAYERCRRELVSAMDQDVARLRVSAAGEGPAAEE